MVLFREVLIEKNGIIARLTDLNLINLQRVMVNGEWNAISLTNDRTLYFEKDTPGKYGIYDLNVLEDKEEIFDRIVLFKLDISEIENSLARKQYLTENLFLDVTISEPMKTISLPLDSNENPSIPMDQTVLESSTIPSNSIVNLNDQESCQISFESLKSLTDNRLIQGALEDDDDEMIQRSISPNENVPVVIEEKEEKLSYYEKSMLHYQRLILENQRLILEKLEKMNTRLISVEQSLSYLYERQSMSSIIKLLNDFYLIDIRRVDTRILSSFESTDMNLLFRLVASHMKNDYFDRWCSIKDWLGLSLKPKAIEFNLLGFGRLNEINNRCQLKIVRSPLKSTIDVQYYSRSSYVTFENKLNNDDRNLIVVFEATTAKIYFSNNIIDNLSHSDDKYTKSMKKIIYKLCQLERQIYYLSFYYSLSLDQFFAGLVLFELYRDPSINADEVLKKIMSSNKIQCYVPLLFRLYKIQRFIFTY